MLLNLKELCDGHHALLCELISREMSSTSKYLIPDCLNSIKYSFVEYVFNKYGPELNQDGLIARDEILKNIRI